MSQLVVNRLRTFIMMLGLLCALSVTLPHPCLAYGDGQNEDWGGGDITPPGGGIGVGDPDGPDDATRAIRVGDGVKPMGAQRLGMQAAGDGVRPSDLMMLRLRALLLSLRAIHWGF